MPPITTKSTSALSSWRRISAARKGSSCDSIASPGSLASAAELGRELVAGDAVPQAYLRPRLPLHQQIDRVVPTRHWRAAKAWLLAHGRHQCLKARPRDFLL